MRASLAIVLAVVAALAGCASPTPPTVPTPNAPVARVLWAPDCSVADPAGNWTEPCLARAGADASPSDTQVGVAADPADARAAVAVARELAANASGCAWITARATADGGRSWRSSAVGGEPASRVPGDALYGWSCAIDPAATFGKDGAAHVSFLAYGLSPGAPRPAAPVGLGGAVGSEVVMASSTDGGASWPSFVTLHVDQAGSVLHDGLLVASSPSSGTTFTAWNSVSQGVELATLVAVRAGGAAPQPPVALAVPTEPGGAGATALMVAGDGTVLVALQAGANVYLASSSDDGATFGAPVRIFAVTPIATPLPNASFPVATIVRASVDRSGSATRGCVVAVWADGAEGPGRAEVLSRHSCDKGASWSAPARVERDDAPADHWMPGVAVGGDGTVHVAYLTRAYDPAHRLADAEYAYSRDAGVTWTTKRLTARPFDPDLGRDEGGSPSLGLALGVDAQGPDRAYAALPDAETGACQVAVAALIRSG